MDKNNTIRDLIIMYVKENYKNYLQENNIESIKESEIPSIVNKLYVEKKNHLKVWLKQCLQKIQGDEYIGDLAFQNIIVEVFQDDKLNCARLVNEIKYYQNNNKEIR
tara:strand:+ start:993 stop:1313 length:321 start_codon:yes stop_codon:yes gene_type:complete